MILAHDHYTIRYDCNHDMLRAVRVTGRQLPFDYIDPDQRHIRLPGLCAHCEERLELAQDRETTAKTKATHYIVEGHKMRIYKNKGNWLGRRYENSVAIYKYFGAEDPRSHLEEVYEYENA